MFGGKSLKPTLNSNLSSVSFAFSCPSKATKYLFLLCRYYALGYFMCDIQPKLLWLRVLTYLQSIRVYSIFGLQWRTHIPASRTDCKTWIYVHVTSFSILYMGAQLVIIRKGPLRFNRCVWPWLTNPWASLPSLRKVATTGYWALRLAFHPDHWLGPFDLPRFSLSEVQFDL